MREGVMIDLPCYSCGKLVTVTVRNAVERGVPMDTIRRGQEGVTTWFQEPRLLVRLPPCREHSGMFS